MKVKDLKKIIADLDDELDVAVLDSTDEYWGHIYGIADSAEVRDEQTQGPKSGQRGPCLVITAEKYRW